MIQDKWAFALDTVRELRIPQLKDIETILESFVEYENVYCKGLYTSVWISEYQRLQRVKRYVNLATWFKMFTHAMDNLATNTACELVSLDCEKCKFAYGFGKCRDGMHKRVIDAMNGITTMLYSLNESPGRLVESDVIPKWFFIAEWLRMKSAPNGLIDAVIDLQMEYSIKVGPLSSVEWVEYYLNIEDIRSVDIYDIYDNYDPECCVLRLDPRNEFVFRNIFGEI